MTVTEPPSDEPRTEGQFREHLVWLLRAAHDNGVDVEGGWMDRSSNPDRPDWGIEIYEVTKPGSAPDVG